YEDRADLKQVQTAGGLNLLVAIVADGVGSADNGGLAAQLSINSVISYMTESEETDIPLLITNALKYANYVVYKDVLTRNVDASTTLIVGVFHKDRFYVGNVGDSRAYWIQESGKMVQLTMDHSYYNIKGGDPNSPQAEALVNAIGIRKEIYADVGMYIKGPDRKLATKLGVQGLPLKVGDTILLCSDGLIKDNLQGERFVKDEEITQALQSEVQPNAAAVKMTGLAEGRYVDDNVTVVTVQHTTPERIENVLAKQYRKSLRQKLIYVALGLLVLAGIITGAFLIKENQRTKQYYASLPTQTPAIVTLPTEVPTPTEVPRLAGEIEAIRVGFFDAENGLYQDRYAGEADYPTWKLGESDSPNPIQLNRYYQLNDGKMSVQTFGDVGVRFSIGSQDSSGQSSGNNQLYVYGGSSLTVGSNEQKRTIISLAEGSAFLKMSGGNEIAEIDFPNHNNTKARLTGGSGLLVTDTESISFWCLNEDCQFEFGDDAKTLRKGQIRVYNSNQMTMSDEIKGFSPPSERYEEYLDWNNRCNHCLPFDYVPEPTPMPTLAFFTPSPDTGGKPGEKTPTPSKYTLTVIVEGQGTVSPSGGIYDAGARVSLTASPDSGWKFASWSTGTPSLTTTIIMDSDKIITARFVKEAAVLYTLTVNIEGQGTVEPNGGQFEKGTTVTLTATPAEGWEFSKWSTGATSPTTTVKMDGNKSIKAIFTQKMYTLTVNTEGQGTVTLTPSGGNYPSGSVVTLKATPASGWKLASWSTGETTSTITVKMDSNKTISAKFVKEAATLYTLTVNIKGNGKVEPNGGQYEKGTVVTLTATPAEGWNF
ncbi:MAG TPA: protein phosphatase 2C domain-containing protein, partial [Anaerolineaceae bacterium]|nr:protein phosphatase 2C domain-containing protein [Anaerolineaceae bacterium]